MATSYITKHYDRLDRICYDRYGNTSQQIVEWIFEQNPGIELQAIVLQPGLAINLPDPPRKIAGPPVLKQVFLWD